MSSTDKNKGQGTDKGTNTAKSSTDTGATKAADTKNQGTAKAKDEEGSEKKDKTSSR
jgi:hypothetical protein